MFGVKVPTGADVSAEVRFSLSRGAPLVAWYGSPDATDSDVTGDMLASRNVVAYLWAAVDRGKLRADDMGVVSVPARIVAIQNDENILDEKVNISLTLPAKSGDAQMSSYQLQREMLSMMSSTLAAMQKATAEAISDISTAGVNAIKEMAAAHYRSQEKAQETLNHVSANTSAALKELSTSHQKTIEKAHEALTTVATSADKLSGLADKIFEDSRERAAALVHEVRRGAQAQKSSSPISDSVKDIKTAAELVMFFKAATEDKDHGGNKK